MQTPGDPREHYLARLTWIDADTLAIQQLNRLQNRHDLLLADARTGGRACVFRDESKTWIDVDEDVRWIDGERAFLVVSERDGWRHVFRVPRDGGDAAPGDAVRGRHPGGGRDRRSAGWLYVTASPDNATQAYLYRARLDGTGPARAGHAAGAPGTHTTCVARTAAWRSTPCRASTSRR